MWGEKMIGDRIEQILKEKKITKSQLAKKLGIQRQTVNSQLNYWKAGGEPSLRSLKKWGNALDIDYKDLI